MYAAGYVVVVSGLFAVNEVVEDTTYSFALMTMALAGLGFALSYASRRRRVSSQAIELPMILLCAGFALVTLVDQNLLRALAPGTVAGDRSRMLAVLLAWLSVLLSFMMVTDGHLLFMCVPSIAMIGLAGTMSADGSLILAFVVMVCAAAFMMVHENFLSSRRTEGLPQRQPGRRLVLESQVQMAALCGLGAILLANVVAVPMRAAGSYLQVTGVIGTPSTYTRVARNRMRISVDERQEVEVATGPVQASDQIVMRVEADQGAYWRGASFDFYTGHGWRNTFPIGGFLDPVGGGPAEGDYFSDSRAAYAQPVYEVPANAINAPARRFHELRQRVTLMPAAVFRELYAASEPYRITSDEPPRADGTGALHTIRALTATRYEVVSRVPDTSEEVLRAAEGPYPDIIRERYLQLPENGAALERIRAAARAAIAGARTNYDRALALQKWLSAQCKYDLNAPAIPADRDVVEDFVFNLRRGYCDSFATALAVLCRSVGIPARVASGFQAGDLAPARQEYQVRERDKHQWTEVYFPTVGWVTFDAVTDAEDISGVAPTAAGRGSTSLLTFLLGRGPVPLVALVVLVVAAGYVVRTEVLQRRRRRSSPNPLGIAPTNAEIVEAYEAACQSLARSGIGRPPACTPSEFLESAGPLLAALDGARDPMAVLTECAVRARYSRQIASSEEVERARAALTALRGALRRAPRRTPQPAPAHT